MASSSKLPEIDFNVVLERAKVPLTIIFAVGGMVWATAMYLGRFAIASDMKTLGAQVDILSRRSDLQELRFQYIEKDLEFLKDQTIELGKATGARILAKPQRGE